MAPGSSSTSATQPLSPSSSTSEETQRRLGDEPRLIDRRPNPHLTFGRGIHACIGRGLAEMQLRVAVEEVLKRTRWISVAGSVERTSWVRFGVSTLPMTLEV